MCLDVDCQQKLFFLCFLTLTIDLVSFIICLIEGLLEGRNPNEQSLIEIPSGVWWTFRTLQDCGISIGFDIPF